MKQLVKMNSKIIFIFIVTILLLSFLSFHSSAVHLDDVGNHWAKDYLYFNANKNFLKVSNYHIYPSNYLYRKETAYAIMKINGSNMSNNVTAPFPDVPSGSEYCGSISWAKNNNVMHGSPSSYFYPNAYITRQDLCVALHAYFTNFSIPPIYANPSASYLDFPDHEDVDEYAQSAVNAMLRIGLIGGRSDGTLAPKASITRAEAAVMFSNAYAMKNYSNNSLVIYARNPEGTELSNAIVYIYRPQDTAKMYPETPILTNSSGIAVKNSLNTSKQYGINVMKNGYSLTPFPSKEYPSYKIKFVTVFERAQNPDDYVSPLLNFNASKAWQHYSSLVNNSSTLCNNYCSYFAEKCPHTYMNVEVPQNFGWRYGGLSANQCEFHQGVDISRLYNGTSTYLVDSNTVVNSIFVNNSTVTKKRTVSGCGKVIQLHWGYEYVTFMHLSNYASGIQENGVCYGMQDVGNVGNTGASSTHLHVQVCNYDTYYPGTSNEIKTFLDPLRFFR